MNANFRLSAKDFYNIVDTLCINYDGVYAVLVAGWDIERYCYYHGYQQRHIISRIEKIRLFLEANNQPGQ